MMKVLLLIIFESEAQIWISGFYLLFYIDVSIIANTINITYCDYYPKFLEQELVALKITISLWKIITPSSYSSLIALHTLN